MQSGRFDRDDEYNTVHEMKFPKIQTILLNLEETVYEMGIRHTESEQTLVKTVATGTYDGGKVIMMQLSGTSSAQIKRKVFWNHLRYCVNTKYAHSFYPLENIPQFVGGTNPFALEPCPFVLVRQSPGVDHQEFLRFNRSAKALLTFLEDVQQGSRFIYLQGIKHRDCIQVLPSGKAVVYPSGILRSEFSGRNSTKRAVRHLLRDASHSDPALPLQAIYELLSAATTTSQRKAIERALVDMDFVTELALWNVADSLELPITRELHYHGLEPNFTLSVGDLGQIEPAPRAENIAGASAFIPFQSWRQAVSTGEFTHKMFGKGSTKWQKHLSSRAMRLGAAIPYFLDCDFPLSPDSANGWVRYDNVLRKVEGDQVNMCLLYTTEKGNCFSHASNLEPPTDEEGGPLFTVRSICVRLRFEILDPYLLPRSIYFHRRPNPGAPPREFWGFISDRKDPLVNPSPRVQEISLRYEMSAETVCSNRHIRTVMRGDSWSGRTNAYVDHQISRLPGAFVA
ncbi:hypothetical protein FRC10_005530 [Ceratobasidium sp. 414]|nr:hypothetical protein FRC10_005530 [Ceratobasidium sp. 414]